MDILRTLEKSMEDKVEKKRINRVIKLGKTKRVKKVREKYRKDMYSLSLEECFLLLDAFKGHTDIDLEVMSLEGVKPLVKLHFIELVERLMCKNGFLTANGVRIKSFKSILKFFDISDKTRKRYLAELKSLNLIKKTEIDGQKYIVLNPLFAKKSGYISKVQFLAFEDVYRKNLHMQEYLLLFKKYKNMEEK